MQCYNYSKFPNLYLYSLHIVRKTLLAGCATVKFDFVMRRASHPVVIYCSYIYDPFTCLPLKWHIMHNIPTVFDLQKYSSRNVEYVDRIGLCCLTTSCGLISSETEVGREKADKDTNG